MNQISVKNLTSNSRFAKSTCAQTLSETWRWALIVLLSLCCSSSQALVAGGNDKFVENATLDDATLVESFAQSHAGYSSDEVLISEKLRTAFLLALREHGIQLETEDDECEALLALLALRKKGKLQVAATKRAEPADDACLPVAEIASRVVLDRHRVSSDTMLATPRLRNEFYDEAEKLSGTIDKYQLAKSVLRLRKIRQLKPELVLRVADWDRSIATYTLHELSERLSQNQIPTSPGVYLFRDASGYLYIGEAENLKLRLQQHLSESDRVMLADYLRTHTSSEISVELHIFPNDSPASKLAVRRAYESELIRSREPKFNVRP